MLVPRQGKTIRDTETGMTRCGHKTSTSPANFPSGILLLIASALAGSDQTCRPISVITTVGSTAFTRIYIRRQSRQIRLLFHIQYCLQLRWYHTIFVYYAVDDKPHLVLQYNKFTCIINVVTSVIKT